MMMLETSARLGRLMLAFSVMRRQGSCAGASRESGGLYASTRPAQVYRSVDFPW